jgi:hypothetical protein
MHCTMAFRARSVTLFRRRIGSAWLVGRTRGLATVSEGTQYVIRIPLILLAFANGGVLDPTMSSLSEADMLDRRHAPLLRAQVRALRW